MGARGPNTSRQSRQSRFSVQAKAQHHIPTKARRAHQCTTTLRVNICTIIVLTRGTREFLLFDVLFFLPRCFRTLETHLSPGSNSVVGQVRQLGNEVGALALPWGSQIDSNPWPRVSPDVPEGIVYQACLEGHKHASCSCCLAAA
jgi:hypothetical protein